MDSELHTTQNSSTISEQKYINLRKRLDQLGYRQTLGIESLPLIEKLFNDLVHTTESLKKSKLELNKSAENLNSSLKHNLSLNGGNTDSMTSTIQAYKTDNGKLIKENNELHLELVKIKDENENQLREFKIQLNKIDHENSDLRFLNTQYLHKLRAIEKESKEKSKKILELQEKNFQAVIQTPSGVKQPISFRRQRLDIDCMLPQPACINSSCPNPDDPYIIDMIKLADERMIQLDAELEGMKQCKEILDTKLSNFKSQVENRDREIERLNRLLDGGRSCDIVTLEGSLRNNDKVIAHQNIQIDFLQDKNHQLEQKIAELMDAKRLMMNEKHKNQDLSRGIKEINRIAQNSEIEKQRVCNAADRELDQAKYEIQRTREELCTLDINFQKSEKSNNILNNDLNTLKTDLSSRNDEIKNLHELIGKIQEDKSKQTKKISKLIENERELVTELDGLKGGKRLAGSRLNNKSLTAKLDSHIKNIENERDFYKQEVDTLQKLLKTANSEIQIFSTGKLNRSNSFNHKSRKETKSPSVRASPNKNRVKSTSPILSEIMSQRCCVCSGKGIPSLCSSSTSPLRGAVSFANNEDIRQLKRERDELKCLLDKFELHMSEIQSNVAVLTNERDNFNQLYEDAKAELHEAQRDVIKSQGSNARSHNQSLATHAALKRVENDRDAALCDLRNMTNERDCIRDRMKVNAEGMIKDKACLEQQIEDLEVMLRNTDFEKKQICEQADKLQCQLSQLEAKLHEQGFQLAQKSHELTDQKSTSTQIRLLAEESERALDEQQRQLQHKNDEAHDLEQKGFKLEQKLYDMQELNKTLKDEVNSLRCTISNLDKDKDKLLMTVDEKTVENVALKQELVAKKRCIDELTEQLEQLESTCDRLNEETKQKQKEITGLRIQLDRANESNAELTRRCDAGSRENKRLQDDLITITRENQVIHCELDKSNGDKEHLKEQITDMMNELNKTQEMLNQKEQDRSNILEQYRTLNNEMNAIKLSFNAAENDNNNLKIEVQMKYNDNKRFRERQEVMERDLQQQFSACQEYEVKLSSANRSLQRLEETFKKLQQENKELAQDLLNSRELSSRLEQNKEDLMRQMTSKELDYEQMNNELADKRAEIDLLKSQLNSERGMVKNLEELIACNREKDFQMQMSTQERDSEIKLLKDRICLGEQKIQSQNKEITVLRSKLCENESDLERMKRQITNERFEREKCAQELRKIHENSIHDSSSRYNSRCHSPVRSCQNPISLPLPLPLPCHNSGGAAAAVAAAARAAADSSIHAASMTSCYRSISPVRSLSPCKESRSHMFTQDTSSNHKYSTHYESERRISPSRPI